MSVCLEIVEYDTMSLYSICAEIQDVKFLPEKDTYLSMSAIPCNVQPVTGSG